MFTFETKVNQLIIFVRESKKMFTLYRFAWQNVRSLFSTNTQSILQERYERIQIEALRHVPSVAVPSVATSNSLFYYLPVLLPNGQTVPCVNPTTYALPNTLQLVPTQIPPQFVTSANFVCLVDPLSQVKKKTYFIRFDFYFHCMLFCAVLCDS